MEALESCTTPKGFVFRRLSGKYPHVALRFYTVNKCYNAVT